MIRNKMRLQPGTARDVMFWRQAYQNEQKAKLDQVMETGLNADLGLYQGRLKKQFDSKFQRSFGEMVKPLTLGDEHRRHSMFESKT